MAEHLGDTGVIKVNGAWATSLKFETPAETSRTGALEVRFMQGRAEIAKMSLTAEQVEDVLGERNRATIQKYIVNAKEDGVIKGELRGAHLHYREVSVASATAQEDNGISVDRYRSGEVAPGVNAAIGAKAALDAADVLSGRSAGAVPTEPRPSLSGQPSLANAQKREGTAPQPRSSAHDAGSPNELASRKTGPLPVPPHIASKYLVKKDTYHFDDQTVAFVDRGTRLTAETHNKAVIQDLVAIAKARDWLDVTVRGAATFRREAWKEAHAAGLNVKGYTPTELELEAANKERLRRNGPNEVVPDGRNRKPPEGPGNRAPETSVAQRDRWSGTLVAHGAAPYQNDPEKSASYFVTLKDESGKEHTHWGVGLSDAITASRTAVQVGDVVGLQRVGATTVTVSTRTVDEHGEVITEPLTTKRNQWVVEGIDFFKTGHVGRADTSVPPAQVSTEAKPMTAPTPDESKSVTGQGLTRAQEAAAAVRSATTTREELQRTFPQIHDAVFDHLRSHDQLAQAYVKAGLIRESDREQVIATMRDRLAGQLERGEALKPLDNKTVQRTIAQSVRRVAADIGRHPVEINPERAAEQVLTPKSMVREDPQVRA